MNHPKANHGAQESAGPPGRPIKWGSYLLVMAVGISLTACGSRSTENGSGPGSSIGAVTPLPSLTLSSYEGRWHQVGLYPNRFQRSCVSETSAQYRALDNATIEVINRCKDAKGAWEEVRGAARPRAPAQLTDGILRPASLEVSFLPQGLRWLPVWGSYDVLHLSAPADAAHAIAIVGEPSRTYLWVLARQPALTKAEWTAVQQVLVGLRYDTTKLQRTAPSDR